MTVKTNIVENATMQNIRGIIEKVEANTASIKPAVRIKIADYIDSFIGSDCKESAVQLLSNTVIDDGSVYGNICDAENMWDSRLRISMFDFFTVVYDMLSDAEKFELPFDTMTCAMKNMSSWLKIIKNNAGKVVVETLRVEWDRNGKAIGPKVLSEQDLDDLGKEASAVYQTTSKEIWESLV